MIAGRYSLERELGRGGTGAVWLGRDELLGRPVALKRLGLLPGDDHTDVARAEREAQLSARLHHPHVVAVYDVAGAEGDDQWLVMEHVDGATLADLVRQQGRLTPERAAPLLAQVADGLAAAHAAGITHRDVKPSNILVGRDGRAKLTDFGIARVATDASLTQTGLMTGSPQYLAPEVATGSRGEPAADVWSLGATAYHVLAGRPPYEVGDHVLATLYRVVNDEQPRLEGADRLTPLLENTLVKDPAQRWTAAEVRDFLARPAPAPVTLRTGPVEPHEEDRTRSLAPLPPSPGRAVLVGLAAATVLLLAGLGYAVLSRGGSVEQPAAAGSPTPSARPVAAAPTAKGMEAFIRSYVRTVADDPEMAWTMLTPKFQRESGGLEHYRRFWDSATNGKVLSIEADPASLSVTYQVHFDHWDNGPGPTVLDLQFDRGRYLIDGERSRGFVPAG